MKKTLLLALGLLGLGLLAGCGSSSDDKPDANAPTGATETGRKPGSAASAAGGASGASTQSAGSVDK